MLVSQKSLVCTAQACSPYQNLLPAHHPHWTVSERNALLRRSTQHCCSMWLILHAADPTVQSAELNSELISPSFFSKTSGWHCPCKGIVVPTIVKDDCSKLIRAIVGSSCRCGPRLQANSRICECCPMRSANMLPKSKRSRSIV